jgi:hypothetical protein
MQHSSVLQYTLNDKLPIEANLRIISGMAGLIIIVVMAFILLIIPYVKSRVQTNRWNVLTCTRQTKSSSGITQSIFNAEILDKKQAYERGKDSVYFRSKFRGYLTDGFFANLIFAPNKDKFENITENLSVDRDYVRSWCPETLDHLSDNDKGKLNGSVDTEWKYWNWKIPEFAPLGDCKVEMSVWNTLTNNKQPFITHTDYIRIIDKDSSHYRRFDRVNTGEIEFPHER